MTDASDSDPTSKDWPAPFVSSVMHVKPEWIDYNGHLNMAYYNVLFDQGIDEAFETLGLGADYVKTRGNSYFTAETHICYIREIGVDDPVRVKVRILDHDAKKVHVFEELVHAEEGWTSATLEQMSLHVDMTEKKVSPWPDDIAAAMAAMHEAHSALPTPPQVGRVIGIKRK